MIFTLKPRGLDPLDVSISATRARTEHLRNRSMLLTVTLGLISMLAAFIDQPVIAMLVGLVAMTAAGVCLGFAHAAYGIALCDIYADIGGRRVR